MTEDGGDGDGRGRTRARARARGRRHRTRYEEAERRSRHSGLASRYTVEDLTDEGEIGRGCLIFSDAPRRSQGGIYMQGTLRAK